MKLRLTILFMLIYSMNLMSQKNSSPIDFVKGADVGFLPGQERRGIRFHDRNGHERDCLELLKTDYQMSAIRMRVWVNPRGGMNDKNELLSIAKRVKSLGMDLMVDFHYSDSWADPGKQPIPKAWLGHSYDEMKFDMVGMSLYPYWAMEGHPELKADDIISDCIANIRHVSEKYGCDVMIVETGFEVDESHPEVMDEGRRQLSRIIQESRTETNGHCRGVFYWEPQCLPGGYKLGAFDSNASPTAIMEGFIE